MKTLGIGLYWDNLEVGERFRTLNRTVTEPDIVNFIGVTGMVETLFTDLTFGDHGGGPMGGRVAPAALVYTMTEGLLVQSTMQTTGLALLEVEKKVLAPVFAGDTIHAETRVLEVKESKSKPDRGVVTVETKGFNQEGEEVCYFKRKVMVWKKEAAPARQRPYDESIWD